jgi:hypothetical protein
MEGGVNSSTYFSDIHFIKKIADMINEHVRVFISFFFRQIEGVKITLYTAAATNIRGI